MVVDKDPWLGVAWKVYAVQGNGGPHLKPSGKEGSFTLSATRDPASGQTAFYTVDYSGDDMPPCWQALLLYPHGNLPFSPPSPRLQPWTPSGDAPWLSAADAVRQGLNDTMGRLEGVLNLHKTAAIVTLVCVPGATTLDTPLLVMKLASTAQSASVQPLDIRGGGHGDN